MQQVEFRLYYDDNGSVLFYTCEKPEGKYIVIDSLVYAACRMDIKIVDGNIILVSDDYSNINNWDIQIRTVTGA